MIGRIVTLSVEKRWLVLLFTVAAALIGIGALRQLPIDAVPDITNNQVQINVVAPALSPDQIEKQVAFTVETALAGIPASNIQGRSAATASLRSRLFSPKRPISTSHGHRSRSGFALPRKTFRRG